MLFDVRCCCWQCITMCCTRVAKIQAFVPIDVCYLVFGLHNFVCVCVFGFYSLSLIFCRRCQCRLCCCCAGVRNERCLHQTDAQKYDCYIDDIHRRQNKSNCETAQRATLVYVFGPFYLFIIFFQMFFRVLN